MIFKDLAGRLRLDRDDAVQALCDVFGVEDLSAELPLAAIRGMFVLEFLELMLIGRTSPVRLAILKASKPEILSRTVIRIANNRYVALAGGAYFDAHDRKQIAVLPPVALRSMIDVEVVTQEKMKNVEGPDGVSETRPVCDDPARGDA